MSFLEVNGLSFAYGSKPIFSDVSFSVEEGQIFCLVGPNGSGKTTLEHCLLAHLTPKCGSIRIRGKEIQSYSPTDLAAEIAYVPQNHSRSFPYRALDVVAMGQTRRRKPLQLRTNPESALQAMESLGIAHLAETEYTTLSGGELQLVLMARALAQESRMLILDEPAAHLDIQRTQQMLHILTKLVKEQNKTILMSTHDFNHPLLFQDEGAPVRMALMHRGTLSETAAPDVLLSSNRLQDIYGIQSRIVEITADKPRHYLAAWTDAPKGPSL